MAASSASVSAAPVADDRLVSSLITLMERGTAPWRREWDARRGGHHVNLFSGRGYRGANPILLTLGLHQRGAALPYWCGAGEAKAHGLTPKRGSKAVIVVRPQVRRASVASQGPDAADPGTGNSGAVTSSAGNPGGQTPPATTRALERLSEAREARPWVRYQPVPLFNAEDLEGEALAALIQARQEAEQPARRSEPERLARAEAVLRAWPVPVRHGGGKAFYNPQEDSIQLPERQAFHSAAALYATWAHEALHSTGHASRLARDLSGTMGEEAYAREELLAELGAVLLGERLEIGSDVGNHAAYLAEWIKLLRQSPKILYKLLSEARQAADLICPADS
ncbi:MAG: zincin-like metallopeptidase domain-containing protein [Cyanobacteriota bacterium]|nr:zincin-like metallopeptidase domain-containing protein [Cyanobacteriota bacterium]